MLYAQLQGHLGTHTIVASNSSTIPVQRLAGGLAEASQFCGMHFFHPVRQRPLVEIVCGPQTSPQTIATAVAHVQGIARIPIVVEDGPGFVVNRLLFPYLSEALELLREGRPIDAIEGAAAEFGMAIGPLRLMDEIGLDTILHAAWVLSAAFPERVVSSPLLVSMVKAGRLGRKTGAGFFGHGGPTSGIVSGPADAAVAELLAPWIDAPPRTAPENIACRLVLPMLLEATRLLEEGKVHDPVTSIRPCCLGWDSRPKKAAYSGGPTNWEPSGSLPCFSRWPRWGPAEPTPLLRTLAETGGRSTPPSRSVPEESAGRAEPRQFFEAREIQGLEHLLRQTRGQVQGPMHGDSGFVVTAGLIVGLCLVEEPSGNSFSAREHADVDQGGGALLVSHGQYTRTRTSRAIPTGPRISIA